MLGITIYSRSVWGSVKDWRVSEEDSLSDHRLVTFRLESKDRDISRNVTLGVLIGTHLLRTSRPPWVTSPPRTERTKS